jgi:integrase
MAKPLPPNRTRELLERLEEIQTVEGLPPQDAADYLIFETLVRTGMRTEEAIRMKASYIDRAGTISVRACKGSDDHDVPVPVAFARRLAGHLHTHGTLLGHRCRDASVATAKAYLRALWGRKKVILGVPSEYSLHSLRGAFALLVYVDTKDILLIKELLGHREIKSTMAYVRMSQVHLNRKAILKAVG